MCKDEFENYYYNYIGYCGKENIICSLNREIKVNDFYYPVIASKYDNKIIYSITPKYFKEIAEKIEMQNFNDEQSITGVFKEFFQAKNLDVSIQTMLRMSKNRICDIDISKVVNINENYRDEYYNSFENYRNLEYKEEKWSKVKNLKYLNGIIEDDQIVSLGFVSNIDYNGANIVIQTKEKYRNRGYGKSIVEKISRDLLKNHLIPIYWVNIKNDFSRKLAYGIFFEEKVREIVVKINNANVIL